MPRSRPDVCILTANLGGVDDLVPQTSQDIPVEWRYYTDDRTLEPNGWLAQYLTPNGKHPCLAAKSFKFLPPVPHRYVIWIDANVRVESKRFAREALSFIQDGLAVHAHPFRDCIYQEAVETILTPKYDELPIAQQVRHYHREDGYPPHGGLYACGVIAWDRSHPKARLLGKEWMKECERWSFQDQLSFPVVCRRLSIEPGVFPHQQYRSPWLRILPHR